MRDQPDIEQGSAIWAATDAILTGRLDDWEAAIDATPPEQRSLMRELRSIADLIAAHEQRQRMPLELRHADAADPVGVTWGPLEIIEKIGSGAFGDVYRAREARLDRQVALKFYRPRRLGASQLTSELIEEGRLLARIRHPNVVTVHGAKHLDGRFGIWMELIEGSTLEEIIAAQGPLDAIETMEIGRELCGALTAIHEAGILHRDIKARNVMREQSGRVVLMDLGIGCETDGDIPVRQYGTPLYAAPEVLFANESSQQGDIYSLGVLLYFLVSGGYPATGSTPAEIRAAHEAGRKESLTSIGPDLPDGFRDIVEKSLAIRPEDRFASAAEMERALADTMNAFQATEGAGRDEEILARTTTHSRPAYNQFLKGRHFWNDRYARGLPKALAGFRRAVQLDPEFALAYVGIADCLNLLSYDQYVCPRDGFAKARAAAEKALELAPDLGEPLVSLGWVSTFRDWDFAAAERYYRQAIHLCPQYGLARQWLALMLMSRERYDEALDEIASARELDPASFLIGAEGTTLFMAGRIDEAEEFYQVALETNPDAVNINTTFGMVKALIGELEDAETYVRRAIAASRGEYTYAVSNLAILLALWGREVEARKQIEYLEELAQRRYVSHYHRLAPWIALGRYDKWGPMLATAIEERDPYLVYLRTTRRHLDWLNDPRLAEPLRRVGLLD